MQFVRYREHAEVKHRTDTHRAMRVRSRLGRLASDGRPWTPVIRGRGLCEPTGAALSDLGWPISGKGPPDAACCYCEYVAGLYKDLERLWA